jgi:hypothetical protein
MELERTKLTVLIGDNLPELGTDLVTALTSLDMDDFTHFGSLLLNNKI